MGETSRPWLTGSSRLPGAEEVVAEWAKYEAEMSPDVFQAWCEEQANLVGRCTSHSVDRHAHGWKGALVFFNE